MFTLTSAATKVSILALSAFSVLSAMDSVVQGFQHPSVATASITLPSVTIVGHRSALMQDTVQAAVKNSANPSI